MRVIAGQFRSRKLQSLPGFELRPTPDRLRESLFSILAPRLEDAIFVDAYAGSGSVGIEALSRGAKHAIFIERNPQALAVLRQNLASLQIASQATVVRGAAAVLLANYPADIAFLDPPYDQPKEYADSLTALAAIPFQFVIAQHPSRLLLEERYGALTKTRVLKQGANWLTFYQPAASSK